MVFTRKNVHDDLAYPSRDKVVCGSREQLAPGLCCSSGEGLKTLGSRLDAYLMGTLLPVGMISFKMSQSFGDL